MALELVDPENRPVPGILWHIVNATGNFVLLFFAYFIREWDTLMLAITLPCLGRFETNFSPNQAWDLSVGTCIGDTV